MWKKKSHGEQKLRGGEFNSDTAEKGPKKKSWQRSDGSRRWETMVSIFKTKRGYGG